MTQIAHPEYESLTIIISAGVSGIGSAITLDKNKMGSYRGLKSNGTKTYAKEFLQAR